MTLKKVKLSDASKKIGKSRKEFLEKAGVDELRKRANEDPDNQPLNGDELNEFEIAKERKKNDKKSKD
jgi:hypothetical protein